MVGPAAVLNTVCVACAAHVLNKAAGPVISRLGLDLRVGNNSIHQQHCRPGAVPPIRDQVQSSCHAADQTHEISLVLSCVPTQGDGCCCAVVQAVLSLMSTRPGTDTAASLSLCHSALQHLATAARLAGFIRRADLAEAAARLAYNASTAPGGLLETALTRAAAVPLLSVAAAALNATKPADISFQVSRPAWYADIWTPVGLITVVFRKVSIQLGRVVLILG